MTSLAHRLALAASCALLIACGGDSGGDVSADANKTPAQVKEQAAGMETTQLEARTKSYEAEIQDVETQLEDLAEKIKQKGGAAVEDTLDGMLGGEGTSDEVKADIEQLQAELSDLKATLKDLKAKFDIYMAELESRMAGS